MAKENKSILEEALLDAKKIQEALNANTKEILRSIAKEEIEGLVKESLNEADFEEEDAESEETDLAPAETGEESGSEEETDLVAVDADAEEEATDNVDISEPEIAEPEMGAEIGMDTDVSLGDEIDLTSASDDEVIAVYKKLTGEDEIEVVGNDVHLTVSEPGEYVIKGAASGAESETEIETEIEGEETPAEFGDEEEVSYEIELGGEEETEEPAFGGEETPAEFGAEEETEEPAFDGEEEETEEEPLEEQIPVGNAQARRLPGVNTPIKGAGAKSVAESKTNDTSKLLTEATEKYNKLLVESNGLKKENEEFRTSLKKFRNMLVETVVFNSNLTYVTKLFMEHSTTKDEKKVILRRFDEEVSTLKESKKLYKTIANDLSSRKPITEAVDKKINGEILTSTSKQLNESTAYVDKDTQRIMDLIKRVENKNNN